MLRSSCRVAAGGSERRQDGARRDCMSTAERSGRTCNSHFTRRVLRAARGELQGIDVRLWTVQGLARLLPDGVGLRLRPSIYRLFGIRIGPMTVMAGPIRFGLHGDPFRNVS